MNKAQFTVIVYRWDDRSTPYTHLRETQEQVDALVADLKHQPGVGQILM